MKLKEIKDLKQKDVAELQSELTKAGKELVQAKMGVAIRRESNLRRAYELRRKVAIISGLLSAKTALKATLDLAPASKEKK
jgi:ribosomal protein L29